jgi:hypothetical protein
MTPNSRIVMPGLGSFGNLKTSRKGKKICSGREYLRHYQNRDNLHIDLLVPGQFVCLIGVQKAHEKNDTCKKCTRQVFLIDALVQGHLQTCEARLW